MITQVRPQLDRFVQHSAGDKVPDDQADEDGNSHKTEAALLGVTAFNPLEYVDGLCEPGEGCGCFIRRPSLLLEAGNYRSQPYDGTGGRFLCRVLWIYQWQAFKARRYEGVAAFRQAAVSQQINFPAVVCRRYLLVEPLQL